jgi:hypothetical protein
MRRSWVQVNGELIPKEEYYAPSEQHHMIMPDIKDYKSTITGEMITSRSKHKAHLKQHNCIELGNENPYLKKEFKPAPGLKEEIIKNWHIERDRARRN